MIVYTKSANLGPAAIGKLETPIKMIIEHENDKLNRKADVVNTLFNVEKSNRFGETIINGNEFSIFSATEEGAAAESDTVNETFSKFIEHIQFMKEFAISAEMMEDANYGIAADAKRRAETFTRAYHKTMNKICETALACGTESYCEIANTEIDLTTADGKPLFNNVHKWGKEPGSSGVQSNYYYGDIFASGSFEEREYSSALFEQALYNLSVKLRNMKDESGQPLGYTADTIILPGNRPVAEAIVKKVCGSERVTGSANNDINLHFGNWNVIVLPGWIADDDRLMIMSSEANKNLCGNMFFNRIPLTVTNWVDNHTGNYIWNGRCRFGVGFGSYKHIILAVDSVDSIPGANRI